MDKLIFIYDNLMTKGEQALTEIPLEFISCGQIPARMRWVNDTKKRRLFIVPNKSYATRVVYGGIFLLKEYEHHAHKLHSYYHNSMPFAEKTLVEDLYELTVLPVRPIRTTSLLGLSKGKYEVGEPVECNVFIANQKNKRIQNSLKKRYYEHRNIHVPSFLQMIKENFTTKKED